MKRLHVHLRVDDLARSIDFYTALFGSAPSLVKHDYAKWQIDEPRVNFAISKRSGAAGLDHLGIQVDDGAELTEVAERLSSFGAELVEQKDAHCCYAHSDKAWARDPQGISWETFLTHGAAGE
ncbi:MAG TPA: ArsI/CadI family heavy metal resistance metalloenzyme [Kiloniellaceae bacterium]